ncbi:unnamed protein product [Urochloa humidicola]
MEFKVAAKAAAAAWPAPAHALAHRGKKKGGSRVGFGGFGSAATGTKALHLRVASNFCDPRGQGREG